ncbi:MAG: hypothetical protein OHK0022_47290 [Roseiflexaceae bacterium]
MREDRIRRYRVRRVSLGSLLRMSLTLGWLVALGPALCISALAVRALQAVSQSLRQVENIEVGAFGQTLATINVLQTLGLSDTASTVAGLTDAAGSTFLTLTLLLVLAGSALLVLAALLVGLGYNLIARLGGGVAIDLQEL